MARYLNDLDVNSSADGADVLLIEQSGVDKKITLNDIKNYVAIAVLESVFPVGSIYTQLPGKSTPSTLSYPGTWTDISSSYAGDFFRVDGGDAAAFEAGQQLDTFQGHYHNVLYAASGLPAGTGYSVLANTGAGNFVIEPIADGVNGEPRTGLETRPVNQTVRIWERTS